MMPSKAIPGRPDPDHIYRRFSARDWWRFFSEVTEGAVLHQPEAQACPFCFAGGALAIETATLMRPPAFACANCFRSGDVLDFTAEYLGFVMEPRADALDFLGRWAGDHDLPEVAVPKVIRLYPDDPDDGGRFEMLDVVDLFDEETTPHLIAGLIPAGEVSVMFGESNSFKSFLAVDMMGAIATGQPWHGLATQKGPVLYIVSEGWKAAARKRIRAWIEDHGVADGERRGLIYIIRVPVLLNKPDEVAKLLRTVEGVPFKLICFDLLAGSMEGSEADSETIGAWVRGVQRLSSTTGAAQLHVTHSGYTATDRARGHSHLWGSFSTRLKAEGNAQERTVLLSIDRHKDDDSAGLKWNFQLRQVPIGDEGETSLVVDLMEGRGKAAGRKVWPASANLLRLAMDAVADRGKAVQPWLDGPTVIAIPKEAVREEFYRSHHADHEDANKRQSAKRMAWNRALDAARKANVIGAREVAGEDVIWLA